MPVRLMPAAVVSGEVLDEYNDPVQDAEIRLLAVQMRFGQMSLRVAGKAMTDDRGEYRIAGLHPGKYYVAVEYKSKALTTLNSIVETVNALQKTTDKQGKPFKVEMPGVPDPAGAKPEVAPRRRDCRQFSADQRSCGFDTRHGHQRNDGPASSVRVCGRILDALYGGRWNPRAGFQTRWHV
jgi:hypothetical protein